MLRKAFTLQQLNKQYKVPETNLGGQKISQKANTMALDEDNYERILIQLQREDCLLRHFRDLPHPPNAWILLNYATPLKSWSAKGKGDMEMRLSVHPPNNCVVYLFGGKTAFGIIEKIFLLDLPNPEPRLIVRTIENKYANAQDSTNALFWSILSLFKLALGHIGVNQHMICPKAVRFLCAYRKLKNDVFGLGSQGILLRPLDQSSLPQSSFLF
jgi:hypothetical protein